MAVRNSKSTSGPVLQVTPPEWFPAPARVETRLVWQQRLTRDEPRELSVVLDEAVLRRHIGDRSVMHAQLKRLADTLELRNITVQILPLDAGQRLAVDSFTILRFGKNRKTTLHDVISTEHLRDESYVEGETDTYQNQHAFDHLGDESLSRQRPES